jgi:GTPase
VADLMEAVVSQLPAGQAVVHGVALRVAVVGRPNVGKSSYINALLGSDRVIVADEPGTTRDSIEIPFVIGQGAAARHYVLIDTAGMRKVRRVHNSVERFSLFRAEESIRRADIVLLMLDAEEGPTEQDKKIAAIILDHHKGCVLIVNKWDLAGGIKPPVYEEALRRVLFFLGFAPLVFVSAKSGANIRKSVAVIDEVARQMSTELTTGLLNRVLRDAFERVQPPSVRGHRLKLYYATQTGTQPVWIRVFVNDRERVTEAYRSYLVAALRKNFGLGGAPVVLDFKSSHGERAAPRKKEWAKTPRNPH